MLVVDDDDDTRELVRTILEYAGALVTLAAGAPAALEVVARLSPDVILSDIAMPGADGYALLRQVRASTPEQAPRIPAIAVTATVECTDRSGPAPRGSTLTFESRSIRGSCVAPWPGWSGRAPSRSVRRGGQQVHGDVVSPVRGHREVERLGEVSRPS